MEIRIANENDFSRIWPIFEEIVSQGDTYGFPSDIDKTSAQELWLGAPRMTFIAIEREKILGSYYLKPNHNGPGAHVCNCGYMVSNKARNQGLATAMCQHSQKLAIELGYLAMQFNFVASTNTGAIRLWQKLGFSIVGTLPKAFRHPQKNLVDAHIMYKWLGP